MNKLEKFPRIVFFESDEKDWEFKQNLLDIAVRNDQGEYRVGSDPVLGVHLTEHAYNAYHDSVEELYKKLNKGPSIPKRIIGATLVTIMTTFVLALGFTLVALAMGALKRQFGVDPFYSLMGFIAIGVWINSFSKLKITGSE